MLLQELLWNIPLSGGREYNRMVTKDAMVARYLEERQRRDEGKEHILLLELESRDQREALDYTAEEGLAMANENLINLGKRQAEELASEKLSLNLPRLG